MFLCLHCKRPFNLPACPCGHTIEKQNGIWQLSDAPDIVTDGEQQYIGYEHIGKAYSGERAYRIESRDKIIADECSHITADGVLLDLGCGDGCLTVPLAAHGTHVIAGDISNAMLHLLQDKAEHNGVSLDSVILCRMNALDIPLADHSVDCAVASSVLHLISTPETVIREIYRVLKTGGTFLCLDDAPGQQEATLDNATYNDIVSFIYTEYWKRLQTHGVTPTKYSWSFDRDAVCRRLFSACSQTIIPQSGVRETALKDGFLPRFASRGFSDQTKVPTALHKVILNEVLNRCRRMYGTDFDRIVCKEQECDIVITQYIK